MKFIGLLFAFIFWLILTAGLTLSVIGLLLICPKANYTDHYKSVEETRSTWMGIGWELKNELISCIRDKSR